MVTRKAEKNKTEKPRISKACGRKKLNKKTKSKRRMKRGAAAKQWQRARGLDEQLVHKVSKSTFGKLLHHKLTKGRALTRSSFTRPAK